MTDVAAMTEKIKDYCEVLGQLAFKEVVELAENAGILIDINKYDKESLCNTLGTMYGFDDLDIKVDELPKEYLDPVFLIPLLDPVAASDGNIYNKDTLIKILETSGISPITREELTDTIENIRNRKPLYYLINEINDYMKKYGIHKKELNEEQKEKLRKLKRGDIPIDDIEIFIGDYDDNLDLDEYDKNLIFKASIAAIERNDKEYLQELMDVASSYWFPTFQKSLLNIAKQLGNKDIITQIQFNILTSLLYTDSFDIVKLEEILKEITLENIPNSEHVIFDSILNNKIEFVTLKEIVKILLEDGRFDPTYKLEDILRYLMKMDDKYLDINIGYIISILLSDIRVQKKLLKDFDDDFLRMVLYRSREEITLKSLLDIATLENRNKSVIYDIVTYLFFVYIKNCDIFNIKDLILRYPEPDVGIYESAIYYVLQEDYTDCNKEMLQIILDDTRFKIRDNFSTTMDFISKEESMKEIKELLLSHDRVPEDMKEQLRD